MQLTRSCYALLLFSSTAAMPAYSQTLSVEGTVQGATAQVQISGAQAGSLAAMLLAPGAGSGPCLGPGGSACLEILPPYELLALLPVDVAGEVQWSAPISSAVDPAPFSLQALLVEPSGLLATTNAVHTAIEPIAALDEEFEMAELHGSWNLLHPELVDWQLEGGELALSPTSFGVPDMWFNEGEGPLFWRELTGDFTVTTAVRVSAANDPNVPPPTGFRLGGLLVRSGQTPGLLDHDWAHVATGSGGGGTPAGVERKETHDSVSTWSIVPTATTEKELRLRRRGASIQLAWREPGALNWTELADFDFPELSATVQVGPMAYSFSGPANVTARFDWVRYSL